MKSPAKLTIFLLLAVTLLLASCSNSGTTTTAGTTTTNAATTTKTATTTTEPESNLNPPGILPVVKETVTLTVAIPYRPMVDNHGDNAFTKWLEEQTNVHCEFISSQENEYKDKINLMLSGGNYPEVFLYPAFTNEMMLIYGEAGIFIPLEELVEQYGINTKSVFELFPYAQKDLLINGHLYTLPYINECYHCTMDQRLWINHVWLETLNLDMPKTTDEYYEVLKAFRDQDPNGNNIKDEIPMMGAVGGWCTNIDGFLMNSFIYNDSGNRLIISNDKADVVYDKDAWQEGLRYINMLYDEGLISPESFTQDATQLKQKGENADDAILGAVPAGYWHTFAVHLGESGRWEQYTKTVPPLKGPTGVQYSRLNPVSAVAGFTITNKCKNPEVAMRWADYMYEQEVMINASWGRKGYEWNYADPGDVGTNGKPAIFKVLTYLYDAPANVSWNQRSLACRTSDLLLGVKRDAKNPLESILYEESANNYEPYLPDQSMLMPRVTFTESQATEMVDLRTVINSYVNESIAKFIVGTLSIDNDWDDYVSQLQRMGLARYLEIYQAAYDEYKSR